MKTFPLFLPFDGSTPTGVIVFSFGSPSSFSVYTLLFFFGGPLPGLVFCCFGGGNLGLLDGFNFLTPLDTLDDFVRVLSLSDLPAASLLRTVLVGAIIVILGWHAQKPRLKKPYQGKSYIHD